MSLTCTTYHFSAFCKRFFLLSLILFLSLKNIAQNLFANPGFEDINICAEYNAACAPEAWYYIKPTTNPLVNGHIGVKPLLGRNLLLVPVHNVYDLNGVRPYVYTMFACPLIEGEKYKLSFYVNTANRKFDHLDFYFCGKEPATRYFDTKNISPTFSITGNEIVADMKLDWKAVEYYYTATGDEKFCMIGNMSQTMNYSVEEKMNASGEIFYFLDEIKLITVNNMKPVCTEYNENIKKMYAQNHRHTDYELVDSFIISKPKPPVFITDTISIPAVFFETNSAQLKPIFKKILDSIINRLPQKKIAKIDIIGYTDNKGKAADNMLLSLTRAQGIKNYLIGKLPQYTDNTFVAGKGQDQPIADNATEQGRTKNRRVEIILTITDEVK